jgi:hypothetical protein
MGLDVNGTQFILYAKTLDVDFTRTAMIGRQSLNLLPSDLRHNLVKFGFSFDDALIERIFTENHRYADAFFRSLGAKDVHSFDASDYEGATHIHDLNQNIPEQFKQQYSVIVDGGSLEHVFNFPVAIKNCMEMVQVGGYYLGITPANNFMGHGFYQFSPELFYSVFTSENGYELVRLIAFEDRPRAEWYLVKSPASVKRRVTLTNSRPVYLLVMAKRIGDIEPLQTVPQQSDYLRTWNQQQEVGGGDSAEEMQRMAKCNVLLSTALRMTPKSIKGIAKQLLRRNAVFDPTFFQPLARTDGLPSSDKVLQSIS